MLNKIEVERTRMKKQPNKFLAPIVIAGVTIGFFASAYKFVFAKPEQTNKQLPETKIDQQKDQAQESTEDK